jgi:thioester reductase-like protein
MKVLLTGASGFLGSYVVPKLLDGVEKLYLLVRPQSGSKLAPEWLEHPKVSVIYGDLATSQVLIEDASLKALHDVTDILHMAANYNFEAGITADYTSNVVGTQNLLHLASQLPALERFHAISTIAIAGDFKGRFQETMFNVGQRFSNSYASTKYRAEGLLGSWQREGVKRLIYRLGVIVGDSRSGFIPKVDGPYYLFKSLRDRPSLWSKLSQFGRMPMPFDRDAVIPLIPVDYVAEALAEMLLHPSTVPGRLRTYHLAGTHVRVEQVYKRAFEEFGYKCDVIPTPRILIPSFLVKQLGLPAATLDYMYTQIHFDDRHVQADFPDLKAPNFEDYADKLFAFVKEGLR